VKKMFLFGVVVFIMFMAMPVQAMTKEELKEKISKPYVINGVTFQARADDIVQLERYLNQNRLSSEDMDYAAAKFDEVVRLLEAGNAKSYSEITVSEKAQILEIVNDVASRTHIKMTVSKNMLIVYNPDGSEFTRVTFLVKQTGSSHFIFLLSCAIVLFGGIVLFRKMNSTTC